MNKSFDYLFYSFLGLLLITPVISSAQTGEALFEKGTKAYFQGNYRKALNHFGKAAKQNPDSIRYHYFQANTLNKMEQYGKAVKKYRKVLELNSDHEAARKRLSNLHFKQRNWGKAVDIYSKLVEKEPDNFNYHMRLGISHFQLDNLGPAKKEFLRARQIKESTPEAYYYIGRILLKQGESLNAASRFTDAINHDSDTGKYYFYRGVTKFREKDYKATDSSNWRSVADFRKAIENGYTNERVHFLLANTYLNRGLYLRQGGQDTPAKEILQKSVEEYRNVLSNDWKATNAFHNIGLAYMVMEEYELAIKSVEKAVVSEPTIPFLHHTLGEIYFRMGNYEKAIESWTLTQDLDLDYDSHPFEPLIFTEPLDERIELARKRMS